MARYSAGSRNSQRRTSKNTSSCPWPCLGMDRFFLLRASGESMIEADIQDGDLVLIDLYHYQYNTKRLLKQLGKVDSLAIYRDGQAAGLTLAGYKKYLFQVYQIYNGNSKKYALPLKF